MAEDYGKKNQNRSFTNKYQKRVAYSYGCKLILVNDKLSKRSKLYLREDNVYNFMNTMIEESKYCSEVMKKMKKHFEERTCDD